MARIRCDKALRKPGAILRHIDIPIAYQYIASKINTDPALGLSKFSTFNVNTGIITPSTCSIDPNMFANFTNGANPEAPLINTLGLGHMSANQQRFYGKLLLDRVQQGIGSPHGPKSKYRKAKAKHIRKSDINAISAHQQVLSPLPVICNPPLVNLPITTPTLPSTLFAPNQGPSTSTSQSDTTIDEELDNLISEMGADLPNGEPLDPFFSGNIMDSDLNVSVSPQPTNGDDIMQDA